jgi:hypothetical protein
MNLPCFPVSVKSDSEYKRACCRNHARQISRDNSGGHDPVERAGVVDAGNASGCLFDIEEMKEIRAESSSRTGAGSHSPSMSGSISLPVRRWGSKRFLDCATYRSCRFCYGTTEAGMLPR